MLGLPTAPETRDGKAGRPDGRQRQPRRTMCARGSTRTDAGLVATPFDDPGFLDARDARGSRCADQSAQFARAAAAAGESGAGPPTRAVNSGYTSSREIKRYCGTLGEQVVSVRDLYTRSRSEGVNRTDADPQATRTASVHQRAPEGERNSAVLRRDEGCARPSVQVGHSPPDHSARGARLHPAAAESGARARGDPPARCGQPELLGHAPARFPSERHRGRHAAGARRRRGTTRRQTIPSRIPVMGRIAAGVPISAIQVQSHTIPVPPEMLSAGEHFALEVRGDSMIDAGILDGDTIIIKRQDTREHGRYRRGADRRRGGDAETASPQGRVSSARSRESGLRDPHLRSGPHPHPRQTHRALAEVLKGPGLPSLIGRGPGCAEAR